MHDNAEYFEHPYFEQRRTEVSTLERRCRTTFDKIARGIELDAVRGERHLDVGCDTGAFLLTAARLYGTKPVGVDIAQCSVAEAKRQAVEAYCCPLEDAPPSLDGLAVITAIDLIEHVVSPAVFLEEVRTRLRPGGVCYLETPNIASAVYRLGRALARSTGGAPSWIFERLFPPEHIQYFSRDGLTSLANAAGLEAVEISTRALPFADIGTSFPVRLGMTAVQSLDAAGRNEILLCMVLRRPLS